MSHFIINNSVTNTACRKFLFRKHKIRGFSDNYILVAFSLFSCWNKREILKEIVDNPASESREMMQKYLY